MSHDLTHLLIATMFACVWVWAGHIVVARESSAGEPAMRQHDSRMR